MNKLLTFVPRPNNPELHDEQQAFVESEYDVSILLGGCGSGVSTCAYFKVIQFLSFTPAPRKDCEFWIVGEDRHSLDYDAIQTFKIDEALNAEAPQWGQYGMRLPPDRSGNNWTIVFKSCDANQWPGGSSIGGFLIANQISRGKFEECLRATREYSFPGSKIMAFTPVGELFPDKWETPPIYWLQALERDGKIPEGWKIFHTSTVEAMKMGQISKEWFDDFIGGMVPESEKPTRQYGAWPKFVNNC